MLFGLLIHCLSTTDGARHLLRLISHNRQELSKVMWERVPYPVRTSLAAAHLLRRMASEYENVDPMTADDMRANADYFEEKAIEVQNVAEGDDQVSPPRQRLPVVFSPPPASPSISRCLMQLQKARSILERLQGSSALPRPSSTRSQSLALPPLQVRPACTSRAAHFRTCLRSLSARVPLAPMSCGPPPCCGSQAVALMSLDCDLPLWRGMALIDLAIESQSRKFLETCCPEVIKIRLYGDMKAVSLDSWEGTLRIILGILTFGLLPAFVSNFVEWTLPPTCESVRRKTQRRTIPEGA